MARILIIDDEKRLCQILAQSLRDEGHETASAQSLEDGLLALKDAAHDIVLTDLRMPDGDGLAVLRAARKLQPAPIVVLMTAHASTDTAVAAMKEGAFDYLLKPFSLDDLSAMIAKIQQAQAASAGHSASGELPEAGYTVGKSPEMIRVFKLVGQIAPQDVTVLIRGESGTGKELVANAIHKASPRAARPMVTVNCTALPELLFENELFGHDREAYTGASTRKLGKFEAAHGSTLFLDEIGDMSLATQGKLLRVLEQKTFHRVGGNESIKVDVRIIVATNVDLEVAVREKRFRQDLFYRLNVFPVHLPPLRERKEDIPMLVRHFLLRANTSVREASAATLAALAAYDWPGNVRQLENTVISSALRCRGGTLQSEDLPPEIRSETAVNSTEAADDDAEPPTAALDLAQAERSLIDQAIKKAGGNKTKAAKLLGITRRALYSKLKISTENNGGSDA